MHSIFYQISHNFFGSGLVQLHKIKTSGTVDLHKTGTNFNLLGTTMSTLSALKYIPTESINIMTFIHIKDLPSTFGTQYGSRF